jgi:ABC-type dipeptide/oligopeptide/nickel transport system permease component
MGRLILGRGVAALPVLLAATVLTFMLFQVVPGDAAVVAGGDRATQEELAALRVELGLDTPVWERLWRSTRGVLLGDLGRSLRTGRPVAEEISERLPHTLTLALGAVGVAGLLGPVVGAVGAARRGGWLDVALTGLTALLLATPVFAVALPLVSLFAVRWGLLPVAGAGEWRHVVLPVVTLALPSVAAIARVSRAAFAEALTADYVRTARGKGLGTVALYARHVWPNAAPPVVALTGLHFGSLLGGAVVVETLFAWPGLGRLAVSAILARDLPVAQGAVLTLASGFILANLAADVGQHLLDPRLRR